jgi:hypothetical protein
MAIANSTQLERLTLVAKKLPIVILDLKLKIAAEPNASIISPISAARRA